MEKSFKPVLHSHVRGLSQYARRGNLTILLHQDVSRNSTSPDRIAIGSRLASTLLSTLARDPGQASRPDRTQFHRESADQLGGEKIEFKERAKDANCFGQSRNLKLDEEPELARILR